MFVRLNPDGTVLHYPYTVTDLRFDTPNASFPREVSVQELAAYNVFPVIAQGYPSVDYTKNVSDSVEYTAGVWRQVWVITEASAEEKQERINNAWSGVRATRDYQLQVSDWTQLPDVPLSDEKKAEWQQYRTALRNVTSQSDPFNINWPKVPA